MQSKRKLASVYYEAKVKWKADWTLGMIILWTLLQFAFVFTSETFLKKALQQRDGWAIALLVSASGAGGMALWYTAQDNQRPCLRVKILSTSFSLLSAVVTFASAAYSLHHVEQAATAVPVAVSVLLAAGAALISPINRFHQLIKGALKDMPEATWIDWWTLLTSDTPPERAYVVGESPSGRESLVRNGA